MLNWLVIVMAFVIVLLNYNITNKNLGIVLLHNNDHTMNKVIQFISSFCDDNHIFYTIYVIKEKKILKNRSTGKLFNIGYRQLSGLDGYLFIDGHNCKLDSFYKLRANQYHITKEDIHVENKIKLLEDLCAVFVSRPYFKSIDGFSNEPNRNFGEFVKQLDNDYSSKKKHGGYLSTNKNVKYNIVDKTIISSNVFQLLIDVKR
jgi:hypothetical protein